MNEALMEPIKIYAVNFTLLSPLTSKSKTLVIKKVTVSNSILGDYYDVQSDSRFKEADLKGAYTILWDTNASVNRRAHNLLGKIKGTIHTDTSTIRNKNVKPNQNIGSISPTANYTLIFDPNGLQVTPWSLEPMPLTTINPFVALPNNICYKGIYSSRTKLHFLKLGAQ
jgi:hypothetical protein